MSGHSADTPKEIGMKLSDDFDARRLRPRQPKHWRLRIGAALGALLATFGILLAMAGIASLAGRAPVLGTLNDSTGEAGVLLLLGLLLLWAGIAFWRRCRRRLRQPRDLALSPHLLKKRD
jgi:membrane protein implicated in regulation of membrane protease activity